MKSIIKKCTGFTTVELMVTVSIVSMIMVSGYRIYGSFSIRNERSRDMAKVGMELKKVSKVIENDLRMAGYGVNGNGVKITQNEYSNDELYITHNKNLKRGIIAIDVHHNSDLIYLKEGIDVKMYPLIQICGTEDTTIHRILYCKAHSSEVWETMIEPRVQVGSEYTLGTPVIFQTAVHYWVSSENEDEVPVLTRYTNGVTLRYPNVNSFKLRAFNKSNTEISSNFANTRGIHLCIGGFTEVMDHEQGDTLGLFVSLRNF